MRIVLPCNMDRLLWNAKKLFRINAHKTTDLNPLNVVEGVRSLCDTFLIVKGEDRISKQANENATTLMKCLVRSVLCSRRIIEEHRLTPEAFEWLIGI